MTSLCNGSQDLSLRLHHADMEGQFLASDCSAKHTECFSFKSWVEFARVQVLHPCNKCLERSLVGVYAATPPLLCLLGLRPGVRRSALQCDELSWMNM